MQRICVQSLANGLIEDDGGAAVEQLATFVFYVLCAVGLTSAIVGGAILFVRAFRRIDEPETPPIVPWRYVFYGTAIGYGIIFVVRSVTNGELRWSADPVGLVCVLAVASAGYALLLTRLRPGRKTLSPLWLSAALGLMGALSSVPF